MYKDPQSLAAALRVFVRRHNRFSAKALCDCLVLDCTIITYTEFRRLFEFLGERSDCYSQINKKTYQWICKPTFFSDDYIVHTVSRLGFKENTPVRHRHNTDLIIKQLPDIFTVRDVAKITGESTHDVSNYVSSVLVKRGLVVLESPRAGHDAAVYRKSTAKPNAEPVVEEKKEAKQDRPLANVDLEVLLNEISCRGIQWRLYGGSGKQPKV